uniref:EamA domain-containing protein n=1 Tax=mine drainage metagenome TaxID=410659 RepID=E6QL09_9ZZZZ
MLVAAAALQPAASAGLGSAGLGLLAAATWGGSDFAGGYGAKRSPALLLAFSGHFVTLLALAAVCALGHLTIPGHREFLLAAAGGLEGSIALAVFYRALALGAMGLTAVLTGLLTALIPVFFALFTEGLPRIPGLLGLIAGGVAIVLIGYRAGDETPPLALLLGAVSGVGFGVQLVLFKLAAVGGVVWAITSARMGGVAGLAAILAFARATSRETLWPKGVWSGFWRMGILAGVLDTIGNAGYILATRGGRMDVAAMVSSLYPGITILLAALVLREYPTRRQAVGMGFALASIALLSF